MFMQSAGLLLYIVLGALLVFSPVIIIIQLSVIASRLRDIARRLPPSSRP
jgi:uncharacterized membrane protein YhaH (DUF805 family)